MNEATITEPAAPAPTPAAPVAPEPGAPDNANPGTPPATPAEGLLANATPGSGVPDPSPASPSETPAPEPGQIAQRPAHIAEQFWDNDTGTPKIDALSNSYNEVRKQNNKLLADKGTGKAPEKAEDYLTDYKPPHRSRPSGDQKEGDSLDRYGELDAGDPVFVAMSEAAKFANISTGQFNDLMQVAMEKLHPLISEPFSAEKETALLGEGAEHMIQMNSDWVNGLQSRGVLNENQYNLLMDFGATAGGVELVNILRQNSGEKPIPKNLNGGIQTGVKTPDECQAMMADPRYTQDDPAGQAYKDEVTKEFAKTYGTEAA